MPGWMNWFTMLLPIRLMGLVFVPTAVFAIMNFIPHAIGWKLRGEHPEIDYFTSFIIFSLAQHFKVYVIKSLIGALAMDVSVSGYHC